MASIGGALGHAPGVVDLVLIGKSLFTRIRVGSAGTFRSDRFRSDRGLRFGAQEIQRVARRLAELPAQLIDLLFQFHHLQLAAHGRAIEAH